MVCNALVAGGRRSGAGQQAMQAGWRLAAVAGYADIACCPAANRRPACISCYPAPDRRPPATKALHTIRDNNTSIVSSS